MIHRLNLSHLNVRLTSNAPSTPPLPCWAVVDGSDDGCIMLGSEMSTDGALTLHKGVTIHV